MLARPYQRIARYTTHASLAVLTLLPVSEESIMLRQVCRRLSHIDIFPACIFKKSLVHSLLRARVSPWTGSSSQSQKTSLLWGFACASTRAGQQQTVLGLGSYIYTTTMGQGEVASRVNALVHLGHEWVLLSCRSEKPKTAGLRVCQ